MRRFYFEIRAYPDFCLLLNVKKIMVYETTSKYPKRLSRYEGCSRHSLTTHDRPWKLPTFWLFHHPTIALPAKRYNISPSSVSVSILVRQPCHLLGQLQPSIKPNSQPGLVDTSLPFIIPSILLNWGFIFNYTTKVICPQPCDHRLMKITSKKQQIEYERREEERCGKVWSYTNRHKQLELAG